MGWLTLTPNTSKGEIQMTVIIKKHVHDNIWTREVLKDVIKIYYNDNQMHISQYINHTLITHGLDLDSIRYKIEIGED